MCCNAEAESFSDYVSNLPYVNKKVLTDGVAHIKTSYAGNVVDILLVNKRFNEKLVVEPVLANYQLKGLKSIHQFHRLAGDYIGMVNGTYFNLKTGLPIGLLMVNEEVLTGSVYDRSALVIYDDKYVIERVGMNIKVNDVQVDNINQSRMSKYHVILYNKRWGRLAPPVPENGVEVVVSNRKVTARAVTAQYIPEDGYVLVGPSTRLTSLKVGTTVDTDIDTLPSHKKALHIISGGPTVLRDGKVYILAREEKVGGIGEGRYNRTGLCFTEDNSLFIILAQGKGLTLLEEATLMKNLGCKDGLNLDGGGSTSGYISGKNLVDPSARWLSNVLVIREKR